MARAIWKQYGKNQYTVFSMGYLYFWPPSFHPQICIYWLWPQFVITGPGPRFVFTGPGIENSLLLRFIVKIYYSVTALQRFLTCTTFILLLWVRKQQFVYCEIRNETCLFITKVLSILCIVIIWVLLHFLRFRVTQKAL